MAQKTYKNLTIYEVTGVKYRHVSSFISVIDNVVVQYYTRCPPYPHLSTGNISLHNTFISLSKDLKELIVNLVMSEDDEEVLFGFQMLLNIYLDVKTQ